MEKGYLQSLDDYLEEQSKILSENLKGHIPTAQNLFIHRLRNYHKLRNADTRLWMFIPVDKDGNIVTPPIDNLVYTEVEKKRQKEIYLNAVKRVIFKGFSIEGTFLVSDNGHIIAHKDINSGKWRFAPYLRVKDLTIHQLEFTPSGVRRLDIYYDLD